VKLCLLTLPLLLSCSQPMPPLVVERVNAHLYRFRQPQNAAEWVQVRGQLGQGALVVKLNDPAEGPAGYSDDYARTLGLGVAQLAIEPKGDGPLTAQVDGVFRKPDPSLVAQADGLTCDATRVAGVHCTHGYDRTGYVIARERVLCEGWALERAEAEWHQHAKYPPYGDRIPAPGLAEAWADFAAQQREKARP
jgi:hypothetical protein